MQQTADELELEHVFLCVARAEGLANLLQVSTAVVVAFEDGGEGHGAETVVQTEK